MANLGVFRDSFYNAIHALTEAQAGAGLAATGTIPAAQLAGAADCFVALSGTSQTFTTDTAVNIIAQLQNAVAVAQKANAGGFASALGDTPPLGVPNLFNLSWIVTFNTSGIATGGTLAFGAGVTSTGSIAGLAPGTLNVGGVTVYVVTVTSATTVNFARVQ